ncbi:MAG TPA: hypothetical protein VGO35_02125 [Gammaproteobacteria bacterium]|jgi:hypothetical protein|nr:hypothetical protein [Gammaproteobacteria bacterium]
MAEQVVVSENALGYLNATRPWVKFLAILGFIGIAFMVLFGLLMIFGFSLLPTQPGAPAFGAVFGVFYFLFAAIYFMPCLFLYRYSRAIAAIPASGQGALEEALKSQKSFWKFMGIVALIIVSIEVLVIVIGVLIAVARHH